MRVFVVLILFGFALYIPALQSTSFYFDDHAAIEENNVIKKIDIPRLFTAFNTRFLGGLSFALNYAWCGLNPAGYRLVDLLIHGLNAFLVYLLIKSTLTLCAAAEPRLSSRLKEAAFFGAMLFLCHPIQTEPVNFVTQRFVLLAAFFYLLTLLLYIQYRRRGQKKYLAASLGSAVAAMLCKEIAVTLPFMLAVYEFYFLGHFKENFWIRSRRLLPFVIIALIVPVLLLHTPPKTLGVANIAQFDIVHKNNTQIKAHVDLTRAIGSVGRKAYFLTELNVMRTYVRLLFVPVNQNLDYDYPITSRMDAGTMLSAGFLLGLLIIAALTFRPQRLVSFSILWFFIALSLESSFIPIGHVIAEYRLYLAAVGFVLLVTVLIYKVPMDVNRLNIIAAAILIGFSVLTYQRNQVWRSDLALWNDVIEKSPHKARGYQNRGIDYFKQGRLDLAMADYNKAIQLDPAYAEAYLNRGVIYAQQGKVAVALVNFEQAIKFNPIDPGAYINRSNLYIKEGDLGSALADLDKAIEVYPEGEHGYYNRAGLYSQEGRFALAMADYNKALEINPAFAEAYGNRGIVFARQNNLAKARADLDKAIQLNPDYPDAYNNRSNVDIETGDYTQALEDLNKTIAFKSDFANAYYHRGLIYAQQDNFSQAAEDFTKVVGLTPGDAAAYDNRGFSYAQEGAWDESLADFSKAIQLAPRYAGAYNNRGNLYAQRGEYSKALSDFNKTIELDPNNAEAHFNRGNVYYRQKNLTQAIADYLKTIQLNPQYEKAYTNLIAVYLRQQAFDKAWTYVGKAQDAGCVINPKLIEALKNSDPSH